MLARLGTRFDPHRNRHVPPEETTIRRVLCDIDGDNLNVAIIGWNNGTTHTPAAIAVDGSLPRRRIPHPHRPRAMATLRNLAISALRDTGHSSIAAAPRPMARDTTRPLTLFGIPA
ncbi:transposase [Amycolatopsis vancoresmycina DSM 44592]|uniref:Transposase n=1 Tax=Amycolatopsis vancoresmycina DSM 44592 TaxID=1292037 RepID=R1IH12_9PSEU|nr:transposase [Amycolatopsis vancoresmycina DSM 44592]